MCEVLDNTDNNGLDSMFLHCNLKLIFFFYKSLLRFPSLCCALLVYVCTSINGHMTVHVDAKIVNVFTWGDGGVVT